MENVKIKNVSSASLVVNLPDVPYRRELAPMAVAPIRAEVYEAMQYDTGCVRMVRDGYLKFILPAEAEETDMPVTAAKGEVKDTKEVDELVKGGDITAFARAIVNASPAMRENIAQAAIRNSVADPARCELIKKYCGIDVLTALQMQRG